MTVPTDRSMPKRRGAKHAGWNAAALIGVLLGLPPGAAPVRSQPDDLSAYISGDRRSGYTFLTPETRALQNDEFGNPGMLWVEHGSELWNASAGPEGRSCATCHGQAKLSMRGVAARYPAYDEGSRRVINLEQRHQHVPRREAGTGALRL